MDVFVSLVTDPYVVSILIAVGIIGLAIEMISPGFGAPGIIGLGSFALYFFGHYLAGSSGWGTPALFVSGLILLILEIFVPSFGILGILGIVGVVAAVVGAAPSWQVGTMAVVIGFVLAIAVLWVLIKFFGKRPASPLVLQAAQKNEQGYTSSENRKDLLGQVGITMTPLRPSGYAKFGDRREDVVSEGNIIPSGCKVKVIQVEGTRVVVRKMEEE
ncbi:NfeD family protein [Lihuaxuella thermophila]|uniref:Membrane-bound serine protease (ClpP class) n=1 Tax=Lihuaxuella thermophila TaxID=1173111 RepID=A0A1H8DD48_9BACL|nr:NfeD family protein [Lihuaxuella thermophila]SEN04407.1 membrane-bound serine protease (ClpP class) [Lihuaxuella thermophila]